MYVLPTGVSVTVRPFGSECSTRSTTLTSAAGDATSGARPPAGPASKPYATAPNGERVAEGVKKRGLIWHTQGSGKSLTMVYAAPLAVRRIS
jgi:hypothetical protein